MAPEISEPDPLRLLADLPDPVLQTLCRDGLVRRVEDVVLPSWAPLTPEVRARVHRCRPSMLLVGRSAAWIWGAAAPPRPVEALRRDRCSEAGVTMVAGQLVTTPLRTVLDLARRDDGAAAAALWSLVRRRPALLGAARRAASDMPPTAGLRRARRALSDAGRMLAREPAAVRVGRSQTVTRETS